MTEDIFHRMYGVTKKVFNLMVKIVTKAEEELHSKGGRTCKLSTYKKVELTLQYLREYGTFLSIGRNFGISESTAHRIVIWVEDILVKSGTFSLPNRQQVMQDKKIKKVIVDVTESKIERPKKKQKKFIRVRKRFIPSKHKQLSIKKPKKS